MNFCLLFWLCIICCISKSTSESKNVSIGRIVGGQEATVGLFPYAAAIYVRTNTGNFFCGGALLGAKWIITAAQCVDQALSFTIKLGSIYLNKEDLNRVTVSTSTYVIHPNYNSTTLDSDIGLIELHIPVAFSDYIQPVYALPQSESEVGVSFSAFGWGQTSDDNSGLSERLRWTFLTHISNDQCKITYGHQITENMMCVAGNSNQGACIGDTGSALVLRIPHMAIIFGVSSFISGHSCENMDPSGYARIYPYNDWVRNVTGLF